MRHPHLLTILYESTINQQGPQNLGTAERKSLRWFTRPFLARLWHSVRNKNAYLFQLIIPYNGPK